MNRLPIEKRIQALNMLVEGSSMRSTSCVLGISINTVTKLLVDAGEACLEYHDQTVRGVTARYVQCDEIWSYCYAKAKNVERAKAAPAGAGDVWTWKALDRDTKLIISWAVTPGRDSGYALEFMDDLRARVENRMQLSTDGHVAYLEAVDGAFGGDIDYAQLIKLYGEPVEEERRRYSPSQCIGTRRRAVSGRPDLEELTTSHVERVNLTTRMSVRRFTRLTNAFSKKIENHQLMLAIYFVWYNFMRVHATLKTTPAVAAGLADYPRNMRWLIGLMDAREKALKKSRASN